jgi:hypothetical protein
MKVDKKNKNLEQASNAEQKSLNLNNDYYQELEQASQPKTKKLEQELNKLNDQNDRVEDK